METTIIKNIATWTLVMTLLLFNACHDPYNDNLDASKLNFAQNDTPTLTALDAWLLENYVKPYNIEIKYRWDGSELEVNKTLVPPIPDKVKSIMSVVKDTWINPYVEEAGETFFKTFCPKQFVLAGSPNYNSNGTITLGAAEGGRKVLLFTINKFLETDRVSIINQMSTIQHEFGHILHQNIAYSPEYKTITAGDYTGDWTNIPLSRAHELGFITSYAMSAPDEDFVEMIATMLTVGKRGFDRIVCSMPGEAQVKIRKKEQIVLNYFTSVYKIDFRALQARTEAAIDAYAPKSLISDLGFKPGQLWTTIRINPNELPPLPPQFQTIYNNTASGLAAVDGAGRVLDDIQFIFDGQGTLYLLINYHTGSGSITQAVFYYEIKNNGQDLLTFLPARSNDTGTSVSAGVKPILDYVAGYTFLLDWISHDTDECVFDYAGLYPQENANVNAFGILAVE